MNGEIRLVQRGPMIAPRFKQVPQNYKTGVQVYAPIRYKVSNFPHPPPAGQGTVINKAVALQDESLLNIIPEFKKILNPHVSLYKRLFWIVAVLACAAICVYQFQDRLLYYLENPVTTDISYTRSQTIQFPAVTICPSKPAALQNISKYLGSKWNNSHKDKSFHYFNTSLYSMWNAYSLPEDAVKISIPCIAANSTVSCDGNEMTTFETQVDYIQTLLGNCTVLVPLHDMEYQGPNTYLYFEVKPPSETLVTNNQQTDIQIFFHAPEIRLVHDAVFMAEYMYKEYRTKIRFVISEFANLNRSDHICTDKITNTNCRNQCIDKKLSKAPGIKCRLPFMAQTPDSNLPACHTISDAMTSYDLARKLYTDMKTGDCACHKNCVDVMYSLSVDVEGHTNDSTTEFILYYADNLKTQISESYAYSLPALVSDVGGSMGFFLGICCLSVLQIVEKCLESVLMAIACKPKMSSRATRGRLF